MLDALAVVFELAVLLGGGEGGGLAKDGEELYVEVESAGGGGGRDEGDGAVDGARGGRGGSGGVVGGGDAALALDRGQGCSWAACRVRARAREQRRVGDALLGSLRRPPLAQAGWLRSARRIDPACESSAPYLRAPSAARQLTLPSSSSSSAPPAFARPPAPPTAQARVRLDRSRTRARRLAVAKTCALAPRRPRTGHSGSSARCLASLAPLASGFSSCSLATLLAPSRRHHVESATAHVRPLVFVSPSTPRRR